MMDGSSDKSVAAKTGPALFFVAGNRHLSFERPAAFDDKFLHLFWVEN